MRETGVVRQPVRAGGGLGEGRAETLASEGFAALALAYFGLDQLPRELVRWQRYA